MAKLWKDAYKIGISQIDQQHKQLIGALEDLLDALHTGGPGRKARCMTCMQFLKDYAVVHFNAEEMYQATIGFAEMAEHKAMHEGFISNLREMEYELIRSDYDTASVTHLAGLLTQWWIYHIIKEDKKMVRP